MSKIADTLRQYSWLLIVLLFVVVISKWVSVYIYSLENRPETIEITADGKRAVVIEEDKPSDGL